jgi:hypothetical protein
MSDRMFQRLKRPSSSSKTSAPSGSREYSFQSGSSKSFARRTGTAPKPARPATVFERDEQGERPSAVPQRRDEGVVYEYEENTWGDVFLELGIRVFEAGFAASALAVGEEIFYYFRQRRLHRRGGRR